MIPLLVSVKTMGLVKVIVKQCLVQPSTTDETKANARKNALQTNYRIPLPASSLDLFEIPWYRAMSSRED